MKRALTRKNVMVSGMLVMMLFITGMPSLAQDIDPEVDAAIMEMVRTHDKALSEHDIDTVMSCYSPNRQVVLMGTGRGERWVGQEEIADAYTHFFMDFDQGTLSSECTWHSLDVHGDVAWVMAMCNFTDYLKNIKRDYALNISAVMEQVDNQWYFATFHFSNLTDID